MHEKMFLRGSGEQAEGFPHRGKKLWAYRATRAAAPAPRLCPVTTSFHSRQSISRSCLAASCAPGPPALGAPPSRLHAAATAGRVQEPCWNRISVQPGWPGRGRLPNLPSFVRNLVRNQQLVCCSLRLSAHHIEDCPRRAGSPQLRCTNTAMLHAEARCQEGPCCPASLSSVCISLDDSRFVCAIVHVQNL